MAKNDNLKDFLTDVADAIREKKGTSEPINPQEFSNEIKGIESGSPFAVDFGEEIATGNPAFINALQEDIDYYNEVKARIASGEKTKVIWNDAEFCRRIAWIPPEMLTDYGLGKIASCLNIYIYPYPELYNLQYNHLKYMKRLQSLKVDASKVTRLGLFFIVGYIGDIDLSFDSLLKIELSAFSNCISERIVLNFPILTSMNSGNFNGIWNCKYMDVNLPMLERFPSNNFRDLNDLEELHLNIPNVTSQSYSVYNNNLLRICHLKGMQCSFNITSPFLEVESVKYMLDNCQQRADGASYTLTLNAAVKTAFLAKCDEDAEYAASLASATEKGLTLA